MEHSTKLYTVYNIRLAERKLVAGKNFREAFKKTGWETDRGDCVMVAGNDPGLKTRTTRNVNEGEGKPY